MRLSACDCLLLKYFSFFIGQHTINVCRVSWFCMNQIKFKKIPINRFGCIAHCYWHRLYICAVSTIYIYINGVQTCAFKYIYIYVRKTTQAKCSIVHIQSPPHTWLENRGAVPDCFALLTNSRARVKSVVVCAVWLRILNGVWMVHAIKKRARKGVSRVNSIFIHNCLWGVVGERTRTHLHFEFDRVRWHQQQIL